MNQKLYKLMDWPAIEAICYAEEDQPQKVLGAHVVGNAMLYQTFLPGAVKVDLVLEKDDQSVSMGMVDEEGFFAAVVSGKTKQEYHYVVTDEKGNSYIYKDPYQYELTLSEEEISQLNHGIHYHSYELLGAHFTKIEGTEGVMFRVWAPNAVRVSVVGDFNTWDGRINPMIRHEETGLFMLFIPNLKAGDKYKYEIHVKGNKNLLKADPYGVRSEGASGTASVLCEETEFDWNDSEWIEKRAAFDKDKTPLVIYEMNLNVYKDDNGKNKSLKTIAKEVIPYVKKMGYTHIELMPVMEYMDDYWNGYQTTGYYAFSSRYGTQEEFMSFVDSFHVAGIGVILDWVPSYFAKDEHALCSFDGTFLYGHLDERQRENVGYDAYNYNYARPQVSNFLIANGVYWIEKFHVDGLRMSGLSSMLYMDYGKTEMQWVPNIYGGNENLDGVEFLKHFNSIIHKMFSGILTIAKETSAWPRITDSVETDGLGFDYVWNTGFTKDLVSYIQKNEDDRLSSLQDLTFSMVYAYSENYILPISHNEIYRNGGSLLECMQIEESKKVALLRAIYSYMMCHPGKKMFYMNNEVEELLAGIQKIYCSETAMSKLDRDADGFEWIRCIDHNDGVLSFLRKADYLEDTLLVVTNFSTNEYDSYKLGLPYEGKYKEIFNSNQKEFGGDVELKKEAIVTEEEDYDGRRYSVDIKLSPLSVSIFKYTPFTKEELLKIAERKVEIIRAQLEAEALEKAKAINELSLKDKLESSVHEAREKILSGSEVEKEVKELRKTETKNVTSEKKSTAKKTSAKKKSVQK